MAAARTRRARSVAPSLPAPPPVPCPRCTRTCTVIRITGQDGVPLTLHSCHFCEHRWWTRQDGADGLRTETPVLGTELDGYPASARPVGLPEVLQATRVERRVHPTAL